MINEQPTPAQVEQPVVTNTPENAQPNLDALKARFKELDLKRARANRAEDWTDADRLEWNKLSADIENAKNANVIAMKAELAELQKIIDGAGLTGGLTDAQRGRYITLNQELGNY